MAHLLPAEILELRLHAARVRSAKRHKRTQQTAAQLRQAKLRLERVEKRKALKAARQGVIPGIGCQACGALDHATWEHSRFRPEP